MNDADIIKALECCVSSTTSEACDGCPLNTKEGCETHSYLLEKLALDLINRQKAEIERLHNILLSFTNEVHTWSNRKGYDTTELSLIPILNEAESVREAIRAEAIIEFAERLKEKMNDVARWSFHGDDNEYFIIGKPFIDQIAKEMKEGVNNA